MPVRASMSQLITQVRLMIGDPAGASQQFSDQNLQDVLDQSREDVRYLPLAVGPSIVNAASTNNTAQVIFADYYADGYQWWESDVVIQGNNVSTGAAWIVLTPVSSDYITGHFTFEANIFTAGTAPGQYPPVYATGKIYDLNRAAADLLKMWALTCVGKFDVTVDGQTLHRSQLFQMKMQASAMYARLAKPRIAHMTRPDVEPDASIPRTFGDSDLIRGGSY